jgi:hypothetical protein
MSASWTRLPLPAPSGAVFLFTIGPPCLFRDPSAAASPVRGDISSSIEDAMSDPEGGEMSADRDPSAAASPFRRNVCSPNRFNDPIPAYLIFSIRPSGTSTTRFRSGRDLLLLTRPFLLIRLYLNDLVLVGEDRVTSYPILSISPSGTLTTWFWSGRTG